ncbi:hypothetical protein [Urechidicola croceus]|uniref:Lipoprotein n=1 Tax=Urechidicola croceus TaxID=1850246 RepID=A0A1D8P3U3_9FLAO|nr:hypothetical protein [Urechidicola croceus]AOW19260.1 hypothetical protein LPB138_00520 [Urechidicola croceus]
MKKIFLLVFSFVLISCSLKETFNEYEKIKSDLKRNFKYEKISFSQSWGTEEKDNNVKVTFYEFNLDSLTHSELQKLSYRVIYRLVAKKSSFKNLDFIEINFTNESESEDYNNVISFKKN